MKSIQRHPRSPFSAMMGSVALASLVLVTIAVSLFTAPLWVLWRVVNDRHVAFPAPGTPPVGDELPLWFVQVSDVHLSRFRKDRVAQATHFADEVLPTIRPAAVVVTGDLTDAKTSLMRSQQYEEEWRAYRSLAERMSAYAPVLDIRGNHDVFGVRSRSEMHSHFGAYSASGREGFFVSNDDSASVRSADVMNNGHRLRLVLADFTPRPGANRPFNFFGISSEALEAQLREALRRPFAPHGANADPSNGMGGRSAVGSGSAASTGQLPDHTFVFGHYPLATVRQSSATSLPTLLSERAVDGSPLVTAYMCGHLHMLLGLLNTMYARHPEGLLELELGDMKENQRCGRG